MNLSVTRRSFLSGLAACGAATALPTFARARGAAQIQYGYTAMTADVGLLNTETSSLGDVVTPIEVKEIPLNGRDFNDLAFTVVGVQPAEQIALTMCRYSFPRTLYSTISPTARVEESTGTTVQSWPGSILPFMELPRRASFCHM